MNKNNITKAKESLRTYILRNRRSNRFDANTLRQVLTTNGLKSNQVSGVINGAIRSGLIERVSTTTSNNPLHNSGRVGVYRRSWASY